VCAGIVIRLRLDRWLPLIASDDLRLPPSLHAGVRWDCVSTDGYQAGCSTKGAADAATKTATTAARPRRCRQDLVARGW
jgi:hypothetical protein